MASYAPALAAPAHYTRVPTLAQGGTRNDTANQLGEKMRKLSDNLIDEEEKRMTAWVDDANGILAFTGLFSATVGAFIIEFYKKLSADPGDQTVDLLGKISLQLTNSRNGTATTRPFSPSVWMIYVNGMWLMSLVFGITSALITLLNLQAVRRHIETPKVLNGRNDHATRVRSSAGLQKLMSYKMRLAIFAAPALLHLSISLFLGGLVIVFHTIYLKVAIVVDVAVGVSGLVYMAMSLIPLVDNKCPHRTPLTYILLYSRHAFVYFAAYCGRQVLLIGMQLPGYLCLCPCSCGCPDPHDSGSLDGAGSGKRRHILTDLSYSLEKAVEKHGRYLTDGFPESVIDHATNPLDEPEEDRKTITWLFRQLSLGDKNKFLVFAASIPRHKVIDLIPPIKSGKIVLRQPLLVLLQSCMDVTVAVDVGEDVRNGALLVCLTAIQDIAKASSIPDLNFVRGEFANINHMRFLLNDNDDSIRITSRSICALVARQLLRKRRIEDADLSWLQDVIGEPSNTILEADFTVRNHMNFKTFLYRALPSHASHLSTEDTICFNETLAILLDKRTDDPTYFATLDWENLLTDEVIRIQQYDPEGGSAVYHRLHSMFLSISAVPSGNVAALIHRGAPLDPEAPAIQAPSTQREAPTNHVEAPIFPRETPSIYRAAPTLHNEAPSFHAEASFPREARFVHHEGPSPPVVPSPQAAPRPRRAARPSQVTRPPLVTPSPRAIPPPRAASPPGIISPAPRPHRAAHSSQVTRPTLATPSPREVPPPRAASPPRILSPPGSVPLPGAVPPSPVVHPQRPLPGRAIPSPRAVFPAYAAPAPRAAPSPSAVSTPSVPPAHRTASPPSTTRRSHTARPPHEPI